MRLKWSLAFYLYAGTFVWCCCSKTPAQGTIVRSRGRHKLWGLRTTVDTQKWREGGKVVEYGSIKRAVRMKLSGLCRLEGRMICCLAVWKRGPTLGVSVTRWRENTVKFVVQHSLHYQLDIPATCFGLTNWSIIRPAIQDKQQGNAMGCQHQYSRCLFTVGPHITVHYCYSTTVAVSLTYINITI